MARDTNKGTRFHSADSNHSGSNSTSPPSVSKVTTQHVVGSFAQARRAFKPSPTRRGPALSLSLPVIWRERPVRAGAVGGPGRAVPGVTLRRADYIIKSTKLKHLQDSTLCGSCQGWGIARSEATAQALHWPLSAMAGVAGMQDTKSLGCTHHGDPGPSPQNLFFFLGLQACEGRGCCEDL
ncbi:uncharacterized protein [Symphalangus syndactylus]|uniref:uncharacterized protein isoform X1 n=1 Tax=Symphalangus syndactylus TaxID=9590 RepID=UPI0030051217